MTGEDNQIDLINCIGKKYVPEILLSLGSKKSAADLQEELDIPIATLYRRLDDLQDYELVEVVDRELTDERRRQQVYRRNIEAIEIDFASGFNITMDEEPEPKKTLSAKWRQQTSSS